MEKMCSTLIISLLPQTFQCLLLNVYLKTRKQEFLRGQGGRQDLLKEKTVPQKLFVSKEAFVPLPFPSASACTAFPNANPLSSSSRRKAEVNGIGEKKA